MIETSTTLRDKSQAPGMHGTAENRRLNILIEVVHPADVLFFYWPIKQLEDRGHRVLILSREKDVALVLLDELGLQHQPISIAGSGMLGLAKELAVRNVGLWRRVSAFKPDIMAGFGGVSIAQVGWLRRVPSVGFYDTDKAWLQQVLTIPFIGWQYLPRTYDGLARRRRSSRFDGIKECSYLHPENFRPRLDRALAMGLDPDKPNFLVRRVGWGANHDLGQSGLSDALLLELVRMLEEFGVVHLSSEAKLPAALAGRVVDGRTTDFHHLMAHCQLVVGESATVACEASILGVPAIYCATDRRSYLDELESIGLLQCVRSPTADQLLACVRRVLQSDRQGWRSRYDAWLGQLDNLAPRVAGALVHHALAGSTPCTMMSDGDAGR